MRNITRILFILLVLTSSLFAQSETRGTISGFVYDKSTGEALIGANVFIEGTYFGSSTNRSGYYSLPKIPVGNYSLFCQYIGYTTFSDEIQITSNSSTKLNIYLEPTTIETEGVYVVAESVRTSLKLFRKPISKIQLKPRQIERMPQVVESDLLRSLQSMPGIVAASDYSAELYVRGGTPDQNLYLIDGADVYNPEHFFGLFSTFNTDAIKDVEISKGGFGAEYGGRLSSVLNVTNLDGNRREYSGKASISLLSAKTTMQLPLGDLGAISGSFRRTYFDKTLGQTMDDIPDYYFYDGHLKAYFDINESNKLTISTYTGRDDLNFEIDESGSEPSAIEYNWGNTTGSIRWTHIFSPQLFGNFWITRSIFDSEFNFEEIKEFNEAKDLTLKGDLEYYYSQRLSSKIGFEFKDLSGTLEQEFPGGTVDTHRKPKYLASYIQTEWRPSPLLEIKAGIRYDYFRNVKTYQDVAPRLSAKYRITDTINLKTAVGSYYQYLFRIPRTFFADIWTSADEYYSGANAHHYIFGFQKELSNDFELEVESYYKDYRNIYSYSYFFYTDLQPAYYDDNGNPVYTDARGIFDSGEGQSYGLEFLLRKDTGPLSGWISYTLGRTTTKIEGVNQNKSFVPRHDRTSMLSVIGNIDTRNALRWMKGKRVHSDRTSWRLGFGFVYATGQPITTTSSVYVTTPMPDQNFYRGYSLYPTERNNFRLPPYIRLDLSLTMEKRYKSWTLMPFIQVYNLTNRKNVWFIEYDDYLQENKIIQEIDTFSMLPLLPTIGVSFIF